MQPTVLFTFTICCFSLIFSSPVPSEDPTCPCEWTKWFNVDHPNNGTNGGDWETLKNIRAQGFNVCGAPRDINCRAFHFPYVPFEEARLKYNVQCDKKTGLICLNLDDEYTCTDFEVQFFCCSCDQVPEIPEVRTTEVPTLPEKPTCPPCEWTNWFNVDHPNNGTNGGDWETLKNITARGFSVCHAPRDVNCRSSRFSYVPFELVKPNYNVQCDKNTGLICLNQDDEHTCADFEVQFLCCLCDEGPYVPELTTTEVPASSENPTCPCEWTKWFNVDHPNNSSNGGDWETLGNITAHGLNVCQAPEDINCRAFYFPYVPFEEARLKYNIQCDKNIGLICLNQDDENTCTDFEVQFLCCTCDQVPHPTTPMTTESPTTFYNDPRNITEGDTTYQSTLGPDGGDFQSTEAATMSYSTKNDTYEDSSVTFSN